MRKKVQNGFDYELNTTDPTIDCCSEKRGNFLTAALTSQVSSIPMFFHFYSSNTKEQIKVMGLDWYVSFHIDIHICEGAWHHQCVLCVQFDEFDPAGSVKSVWWRHSVIVRCFEVAQWRLNERKKPWFVRVDSWEVMCFICRFLLTEKMWQK